MTRSIKLVIQEPDSAPREVEVSSGDTIGRSPSNSCVLKDTQASSRHAEIVVQDGGVAIVDLGSTNGTWEGTTRLTPNEPRALTGGMKLRIGRSEVSVIATEPDSVDLEATIDGGAMGQVGESTIAPADMPSDSMTTPPDSPGMQTIPPAAAPPASPSPETTPPAAAPAKSPPPAPPAPEPEPAARPVPVQDDMSAEGSSWNDSVGPGTFVIDQNTGFGEVSSRAYLDAVDVRLVFVVHKEPQSVRITEPETLIGRRARKEVTVGVGDESVSAKHAKLLLARKQFIVEDLESSNGTFVGDARIAPGGGPREVAGDKPLRFGAVDAFLAIPPADGESSGKERIWAAALELLGKEVPAAKAAVREAEKALGKGSHPGEMLVRTGAVTVAQWTGAVENASLRVKVGTPDGNRMIVVLLVVLLAVIAALAVILTTQMSAS